MLIFLLDAMTAQDTKTAPDPVEVMALASHTHDYNEADDLSWDEASEGARELYRACARAELSALFAAGFKVWAWNPDAAETAWRSSGESPREPGHD